MKRFAVPCLSVLSLVCGSFSTIAAQQSTTLTVFAAASLTEPFSRLGKRFEADHPGATVRFNFAGSQQLVLQIQQGAKADVFASADERWMQTAKDSGLVEGNPVLFARNELVVVVPVANPAGIKRLQDLSRSGIKLVLAAEAVPVGRYTREMLAKLSSQPGFGPKYGQQVLANVASYEDNVKGVIAKVQLGEADAGVVYRSDATGSAASQISILAIPEAANVIASYPIAVLRGAPSPELARAFVELVESATGQESLKKSGFIAVEPAAQPAQ
ncbi:MAG TPA: molybdate ABC transporter substrate-binding protein [Gemmatimonadales bacterium]|nr:molybdate ABC transporter substrate-binding protein [Gemmatimonadales bacterium]